MATFIKQAEVPVDTLQPHPDNPNRGSVKDIATSLEQFGQFRSIVALEDGTILAGHHVWEATKRIGKPNIRVDFIQCDEQEARKIMLADNRLADLGLGPDLDLLLENLNQLEGDMLGTGFDDEYVKMLEEATAGAPEIDDLEDEAGPAQPHEYYRRLTITVDPKLVTAWEEHRKTYPDDTAAFAVLLGIELASGEEEDVDEDEEATSATA
jgi:ParB-like chromosome segregation protein Spo0J